MVSWQHIRPIIVLNQYETLKKIKYLILNEGLLLFFLPKQISSPSCINPCVYSSISSPSPPLRKYNIRVEDIMVRDVRYITLNCCYRDLHNVLLTGHLKTLALVESAGETEYSDSSFHFIRALLQICTSHILLILFFSCLHLS